MQVDRVLKWGCKAAVDLQEKYDPAYYPETRANSNKFHEKGYQVGVSLKLMICADANPMADAVVGPAGDWAQYSPHTRRLDRPTERFRQSRIR